MESMKYQFFAYLLTIKDIKTGKEDYLLTKSPAERDIKLLEVMQDQEQSIIVHSKYKTTAKEFNDKLQLVIKAKEQNAKKN